MPRVEQNRLNRRLIPRYVPALRGSGMSRLGGAGQEQDYGERETKRCQESIVVHRGLQSIVVTSGAQ